MPFVGSVRSGNAIPVELAGPDSLHPDVPDVAGLVPGRVEDDAPGRHGILGMVEEVEADAGGVAAEDREVDAVAPQVRPKGKGTPERTAWTSHRLSSRSNSASCSALGAPERATRNSRGSCTSAGDNGLWRQGFFRHRCCWRGWRLPQCSCSAGSIAVRFRGD